jgi:hypothetical protein
LKISLGSKMRKNAGFPVNLPLSAQKMGKSHIFG